MNSPQVLEELRKTHAANDARGARQESRGLVALSLDDQRYALALALVQRCIRVAAITPLPPQGQVR